MDGPFSDFSIEWICKPQICVNKHHKSQRQQTSIFCQMALMPPLLTALHCNQDSRLSITLELPQLFEKDQLLPATEFQSSDSIEKSI